MTSVASSHSMSSVVELDHAADTLAEQRYRNGGVAQW